MRYNGGAATNGGGGDDDRDDDDDDDDDDAYDDDDDGSGVGVLAFADGISASTTASTPSSLYAPCPFMTMTHVPSMDSCDKYDVVSNDSNECGDSGAGAQ